MELEGRLNPALSLPEVLQFLGIGKMSGTLTIERGNYAVTLTLRSGKLVNTSSLGRDRRLGQLLFYRGLLRREDLEAALHAQKTRNPPPRLGELLIDRNLITLEQLRQAIRLQMEEEMWDLFSLQEGAFKFEHADEKSLPSSPVELELEPLIIEGTRRLDEWARISRTIPSDSAIPLVKPLADASEREMLALSDAEWRVLSLINGAYDMGSIANRSGIGKFETYRIVSSFLASGLVQLRDTADSTSKSSSASASSASSPGTPPGNGKRRRDDSKSSSSIGTSSARLAALFLRKTMGMPEEQSAQPPEEQPRMEFDSPVGFVSALANALVEELLTSPDFYTGPVDDALVKECWTKALRNHPKADLVAVTANRLDAHRFDGFVRFSGLSAPLRDCYEETLDALNEFLQSIFSLAAQRLGAKQAQAIFQRFFVDFRKRSSIKTGGEEFFFQDYAGKVYS